MHFRTVELGFKLASLPAGPRDTDVASMNKLTTSELNRLITNEANDNEITNSIGHVLPLIFSSFQTQLPGVEAVTKADGETLYDFTNKTWHIPVLAGQTIENCFAMFLNTLSKALLKFLPGQVPLPIWHGSHSTRPVGNGPIKRKPDLILSDEGGLHWNSMLVVAELSSTAYTPAERAGKTLDTTAWLMFKDQPWRHFVLLLSFLDNCRELRVHLYDHSGGIVTPPVNMDREPDTFLYIIACIVFRQRTCIGFDRTIIINPKMIPEVSDMFWARNIKKLPQRRNKAVDNDRSESRKSPVLLSTIEPYMAPFHSHPVYLPLPTTKNESSLPSLPPHPISAALADETVTDYKQPKPAPHLSNQSDSDKPIGKITVNNHKYMLLKVLFSCQGLVGRGTVCYLAGRNGEEYIIKDHWVKDNRDAILNEVKMLEEMKGVVGVPKLVKYWLVEVEEGQPNETQRYRNKIENSTVGVYRTHVHLVLKPQARPLYMF
ncbi:hypothetical protein BDR03DRAFT_1018129 [Suillus americanus]|nr:hypothetical protein BDR03DRAFT_1018129 [Suillus americanus]